MKPPLPTFAVVLGPTQKVPPRSCPACGAPCVAASSINGQVLRTPEDSLVVCCECSEVLAFEADWSLRKVTAEELAALHPTTRAQLEWTQKMLGLYRAERAAGRA